MCLCVYVCMCVCVCVCVYACMTLLLNTSEDPLLQGEKANKLSSLFQIYIRTYIERQTYVHRETDRQIILFFNIFFKHVKDVLK